MNNLELLKEIYHVKKIFVKTSIPFLFFYFYFFASMHLLVQTLKNDMANHHHLAVVDVVDGHFDLFILLQNVKSQKVNLDIYMIQIYT